MRHGSELPCRIYGKGRFNEKSYVICSNCGRSLVSFFGVFIGQGTVTE